MPKGFALDLDRTLARRPADTSYPNAAALLCVVNGAEGCSAKGYKIHICTARSMRTNSKNVGKTAATTPPHINDWLQRHDIPVDEIFIGKPWCGTMEFYVDDRSTHQSELASISAEAIADISAEEAVWTDKK